MKNSLLCAFVAALLLASCGGTYESTEPMVSASSVNHPDNGRQADVQYSIYTVSYDGHISAFRVDHDSALQTLDGSPFATASFAWTGTPTPEKDGLLIAHHQYVGIENHDGIAYVGLDADGRPQPPQDNVLPLDCCLPRSLAFHPNGKFVYSVSWWAEHAVRVFARDGKSGFHEVAPAKYALPVHAPDGCFEMQNSIGMTPAGSLVVESSYSCPDAHGAYLSVLTTNAASGEITGMSEQQTSALSKAASTSLSGNFVLGFQWLNVPSKTALWEVTNGRLLQRATCEWPICGAFPATAVAANGRLAFGVDGNGSLWVLRRHGTDLVPEQTTFSVPQVFRLAMSEDSHILAATTQNGSLYAFVVNANGAVQVLSGSPFSVGVLSPDVVVLKK